MWTFKVIDSQNISLINVHNLNLWAHVGVLDQERKLGQSFLLDFTIWIDVDQAAIEDDLTKTVDYSLAIKNIQKLSGEINCLTIEHFSEIILEKLQTLYGSAPMQVSLRKCNPPVDGFSGSVSITRSRNLDIL